MPSQVKKIRITPSLKRYMNEHLPKRLEIHDHFSGYFTTTYVEEVGTGTTGGIFHNCRRAQVAEIKGNKVTLMMEKYYADITDVMDAFEKHTGEDTELILYERIGV